MGAPSLNANNNIKDKENDKYSSTSSHESAVFVRVRPLHDTSQAILPDLVMESQLSSSPKQMQFAAIQSSSNNGSITGFDGIFGTQETNASVYQHALQPKLNTTIQGGTTSFFCYGYTGAGKTHTTLGYNDEQGVFQLASCDLLHRIKEYNESSKEEPLMIQASAIEVYNDAVYDLLADKVECSLRKNKLGQLLVRGPTKKHEFTKEEADMNGFDFSIVTMKLTSIKIDSEKDLEIVQATVAKHRNVGSSSIHDQSSRSHAVLRLDVVNQSYLHLTNELEEFESIKPSVQTAYDKKRTYKLRQKVVELERRIDEANEKIDNLMITQRKKKSPFGGRLLLVDLAGADSDDRSIGEKGTSLREKQESTAINKSLLALKECVRELTTSNSSNRMQGKMKLPYRNSNLTRLLEEVLTPIPNRNSCSVMLVNIGPEESMKKKTIYSLRYGEMYSMKKSMVGKKASGIRNGSSNRQSLKAMMKEKRLQMQKEQQVCI
ncbi:hypothetical protein CTEN210_13020 [Chaetoceros tenuissimus]|uniref:Kinesin motor domain-containing protein n=1 Tax=Chaetoceros tenuissimus TaxID=426638 RepID=A0AAD3D2K2_9STRA|nr:hypothetical protein CTEN210_13020 [Chaetoceros tenuissimus]